MTAKEIYESIDLGQVPAELADKLRKVEKATKGFSVQSDKVDTFMKGVYGQLKEKRPRALKNLKVEEKIIKQEVKVGNKTEVVENLEYKVKGTKQVTKKTPTPSKPARKENVQQEAKRTRKKGELAKDSLARVMKERAEAKEAADKVVTKTSEALKNIEQMLANDPKLAGYPRTYGKQSKRIDANKDAKIKAQPAGKRVSKKGHMNQYGPSKGGRVYWENRDNRSDRYAPNFPNKVFLEMGGDINDLGFPSGHTYLVVEVSPSGDKKLIKSTRDYLTALMSAAVSRSAKSTKDARVLIIDKEDKKVLHETFEAGGEIVVTPYPLVNNPDALVGTTTMTELFECGGVTAYQEGGEVFVTSYPLTNAGSADYVAGSNTMSNMFEFGGSVGSFKGYNYVYYDPRDYNYPYMLIIGNLAWGISDEFGPTFLGNIQQEFFNSTQEFANKHGYRVYESNLPQNVAEWVKEIRAKDYETLRGKRYNINPNDYPASFEKGGFVAMYNGKRAEIDADTLFEAKKKAIQELKVPKSKQGLLSVMANQSMENEDFRFMAKGGEVKFDRDYYGYSARVPFKGEYFLVELGKNWNAPKDEVIISDRSFRALDKNSPTFSSIYMTMLKAKKDAKVPEYAEGGRLGFEGLAKKVAKRYVGQEVPTKYRKEYGKVYSQEEAMEVGRKVAAKVYGQQQAKMEMGGEITHPYPLTDAGSAEYVAGSNTMSNMFADGGVLESKYGNRGAEIFKVSKQYRNDKKQIISDYYNLLDEVNRKEFDNKGLIEKYGNSSLYVLYEPNSMAKGGALEHMVFVGDKVLSIHKNMLIVESDLGQINVIDLSNEPLARRFTITGKNTLTTAKKHIDYLVSRKPKTMARGGSLMGHGLEVGDKIVKDLGSVLKVENQDGDIVYVDLSNGYRGADVPLPFEKGGSIPSLAKRYNTSLNEIMKKISEGETIEMEHTDNPKVARKIALDHIGEDLDYYTKLKKLGL